MRDARRPTGDDRRMDRAKRLAANREASAASRARKRALELETRARCEALEHRVGQLLEHARALACENAGLKNALLEVTYGVRSVEFASPVMFGSETTATAAKLPLPRWDGGTFAANAVTATEGATEEGATAKRQKMTGVVPDVRQQTSTSSGESSYDGSGALTTTTTTTPASEVVLGDLTPLPFDFDDAFDYTRDAVRTKRSFSRGARATDDATTRQGARQRVDGCSLVAPRGRGPRAETSYAIQNMQTNATRRQRMKDAAKRILPKRRRRTRSSTTCSSTKTHSMQSSMRFLPMKATISNFNPSSRASRRRKSTDDALARQQKLIKQIVRRLYPNS